MLNLHFPLPFSEDYILGMFSEPFLSVAPNSHVVSTRGPVSHPIYLPVCLSACLRLSQAGPQQRLIGFPAPSYRSAAQVPYSILPFVHLLASLWSRISVDYSLSTRVPALLHHPYESSTLSAYLPHTHTYAYRSYPTSCQHPLSLPPPPPLKKHLFPPLSLPLLPPPPASLVPSREHTKLSLPSFAVLRTAHEIPSFPSLACSSRRIVRIFPIAYFPIIFFFSFLSLHTHLIITVHTYIHTLLYSSTLYSCACWL
ncbi:hypothetical protein B9Z19DRAFT_239348 [Tuber borchii]|uniref:Uncharacterized protein n=1 Tax=Tuber borchii TaxID=42251 RepID=A0A2T6ZMF0_TUBBO|nr:hypothetical protein B9Z19DRAFT_239348 [Tuber borchii]